MRSFLCLTVLVVCVSSASSDVLRVPDQYGSIQSAINAAVDGDTVLVSPGTYVEQISYSKNINLRSTGGARNTIIQCPTGGQSFGWGITLTTSASDSIIDGFTLKGGSNYGDGTGSYSPGGGFQSRNGSGSVTGVVLRNCVIRDNRAQALGGGVGFMGAGGYVENSVIEYNTASSGGGAYAIGWFGSRSIVFRNTIFRYNSATRGGAVTGGANATPGTPFTNILLYNCTFVGNTALVDGGGAIGPVFPYRASFSVFNSILWANYSNGVRSQIGNDPGANITVEYSNIEGGYVGLGNIDADPMFTNGAAGSFDLMPNSPCIDAGDNARVALETDYAFTWQPRNVDYWAVADTGERVDERAVVDMGAYEFQGDCNGNRFNDTSESLGPFPGSGSALAFDGVDDYARVAMIQPMIDRESTVEFWQYAEEYRNQSSFGIVDCNGAGDQRIQAHVPWGDKTVYFDHGDLDTQSYARVTNSPDVVFTDLAGLWIHWAFVIDPDTNTTTIYRNGEVIQQNSAWGTFNGDANTPLIIGGMGDPTSGCQLYPFRGVIDEFRIWEVARDGAQIRSVMNQELVGNEGGLIAYYPFSEGEGTTSANMCLNQVQDSAVLMNGVSWYSAADSDTNGNWIPDDCDPDCAADLNGDGGLNFFDVSAFLSAFSAMDPAADFTGDGSFNFFDVSAFLSAFAAGCP